MQNGDYISSISELVEICEKEGYIPRYYVEEPQDKVDATIQDLKNYTHDLVVGEMSLGNLIEDATKKLVEQNEKEREDEDGQEEEEIFNKYETEELTTQDYEDFNKLLEEDEDFNGS